MTLGRTKTIAWALLLVGVAFAAAPAMADQTLCNGHTDGDTRTCRGECRAGEILHVYMNLDDASEQGDAATSCATAHAECPTDPGPQSTNDWCWDDSEITTTAAAPWTCHFEAHDVWWQPDNGFLYECSSYVKNGPGTVTCSDGVDCDPAFNCGSIVPHGAVVDVYVTACDQISAGLVLRPGTTAGTVVRYDDGRMVAISCALGEGCWLVKPVCAVLGDKLSCDVSPAWVL
jgi:hypothetical protein